MKTRLLILSAALCGVLTISNISLAGVTPEEAAQLKATLTPFGAEKTGNKEGTIPAWDGGYKKVPSGYKSGDPRMDLFPNEKPQFAISAKNMDQYADKLSEGVKALLKKYPSFRIDVYPTHRTAIAPQWVYDNTFVNATRAKLADNSLRVEGAYGGIPFPIPKSGIEAMWNHKLMWIPEFTSLNVAGSVGTADGKVVLVSRAHNIIRTPYYEKNGSLEKFKRGENQQMRLWIDGPAHKAGEQFLINDSINKSRQSWQYLTGQRRVRKAPTICCDAPEEVNSGVDYWDEAFGFWGDLDHYDWKLVGKKEIYIPYNANRFFEKANTREKQVMAHHLNPDLVRWELHRVWVVDAALAAGKRHVVPKRRFYLDEDTWGAVLSEGWDAQGKLWRVEITQPLVVPEGMFVYPTAQWSVFDLISGAYLASCTTDWGDPTYTYHFKVIDNVSHSEFTPEALAGQGVR